MEQHIIEAVLTALSAIATWVIGYVGRAIVKLVISKHLELFATQAVHFAEDVYKDVHGKTKLKHACEWVSERLKRIHINVSQKDVEAAVRSAYNQVKKDVQEDLKEA